MGTFIYFAAVTVMLYLGEWLGSRGGQLALRMAMNREEASWRPILVRAAMSAPPLSTFERGLFIVLIMAVLFAMPSDTLIERVFLFFFCGLAYSLLQLGFSLLKGYWAVKDAGDNMTEEEQRYYATQMVMERGMQAIEEEKKKEKLQNSAKEE